MATNSHIFKSDSFQSALNEEQDEINYTTLPALKKCIKSIQDRHEKARTIHNMSRVKKFLEGMEQYSKVIEVFLNVSPIVCFVWGPMKLLLQVSVNYIDAFEGLLDVYKDLGESLPLFELYTSQLQNKNLPHMQEILEKIFVDILKFHQSAFKFLKQKALKQLFHVTWRTYKTRFQSIIDDIKRRKELIESCANAAEFAMVEKTLALAEVESKRQQEINERERLSLVRDWLAAACVQEDQEAKTITRENYPNSCKWILDVPKFKAWENQASDSPLLWVHGIPGAGKSTLASFIIEHLESQLTSNSFHVLYFYCKSHDQSRNSSVALIKALIDQSVIKDNTTLPYLVHQASTSGERPLRTLKRSQEILDTCLKSLKGVYIVIDGLDECSLPDKKTIAIWFRNNIRSLRDDGVNVRCLFCCQSDEDTSRLFKSIPALDIAGEGHSKDITTYCGIEAEAIKDKFALSDVEMGQLARKVSTEAAGMFLYAKLVMHNLQSQTRLANLRKELAPGVFPKGLGEAYGRIVNRILDPESAKYNDTRELLGFLICSKRTLKCYLLTEEHISAAAEEFHMTRLCLRYLSLPCFVSGRDQTEDKLIEAGYYIFATYAVVYWSDHLSSVLSFSDRLSGSDKRLLIADIQLLLDTHYQCRNTKKWLPDNFGSEFMALADEFFFNQLVEAIAVHRIRRRSDQELLKIVKNTALPLNNMRMEDTFLEVRKKIPHMQGLGSKYGSDLYRCSRIDCCKFSDGFSDYDLYKEHEMKHDAVNCPIEGCPVTFRGLGLYGDLNRHIERFHDRTYDTFHPIGRPPGLTSLLKEKVQYVDTAGLEEFLAGIKAGYKKEQVWGLFSEVRYTNKSMSKEAWKLAVANPVEEILQILIRYTEFTDTNAQGYILEQAALVGDKVLVERFLADEYDNGRKDRFHPAWDRAMKAATTSGNTEILDIILKRAMQIDRERPGSGKLRELCIKASIAGKLPCVDYLIATHNVNPFYAKRGLKMSESVTEQWSIKDRALTYRHSVFFHAVHNGHVDILRYLLERGSVEQLTELFKREPREDLVLLAASNGLEQVIDLLDCNNHPFPRASCDDTILRARFYNAVRQGNKHKAEEMLNQARALPEIPDRDDWTLLMYAASNGLDRVVEVLLDSGAHPFHPAWEHSPIKFEYRHTAEYYAAKNGHIKISEMIRRRQKKVKVKKLKDWKQQKEAKGKGLEASKRSYHDSDSSADYRDINGKKPRPSNS